MGKSTGKSSAGDGDGFGDFGEEEDGGFGDFGDEPEATEADPTTVDEAPGVKAKNPQKLNTYSDLFSDNQAILRYISQQIFKGDCSAPASISEQLDLEPMEEVAE